MIVLILLLIAGSILAYVAQYNLTPVSVNFGPYIPYVFSNIPLFYVIVGSLLVGLVFSSVIHFFHDVSISWRLRGKKKEIKKNRDEILDLTKRVHQLELENEKLKHGEQAETDDPNAL